MTMVTNDKGLKIIKDAEGLRLKAYLCPSGVYTIGYGHTANVKYGDVITESTATALLKKDVESAEKKVNALNAKGNYEFNENEFSALVSFCFNIGNVTQVSNNGKRTKKQIAAAMLKYVNITVNGKKKKLAGLEKRRKAEVELFNTPVSNANVSRETYTFEEIVTLVINGKMGTGATRKKNVEKYGFDYAQVQKEVNTRLSSKKTTTPTFDDVVKMVISGKLGTGQTRRKNVEKYGYSYAAVQKEVNKRLKK